MENGEKEFNENSCELLQIDACLNMDDVDGEQIIEYKVN